MAPRKPKDEPSKTPKADAAAIDGARRSREAATDKRETSRAKLQAQLDREAKAPTT